MNPTEINTTEYFITDPCYVLHTLDSDLWVKSFCESFFKAQSEEDFDGHFVYLGYKIFSHNTAHGDGVYGGSDGNAYCVDSGLISAIPLALIEAEVIKDADECKVKMTESQFDHISYDRHEGTFTFPHTEGEIEIKTDEEEYECVSCGAEITQYEWDCSELCEDCDEDDDMES